MTAWFILALFCPCSEAQDLWQEIKGKHFVIFYQAQGDRTTAQKVLRRAEGFYDKIGSQIGYQRYAKFWTWDERVKIFLFPDANAFVRHTGQPRWSLGYASQHNRLFKAHTIVTYTQEKGFIDGLLPHEISHLIMADFIPDDSHIPLWFHEGFAQLQEAGKLRAAKGLMGHLMGQGQYVKFDFLMDWDIRAEPDPLKVEIFYAQSLTIVEFLLRKYGQSAFERLFRELRDGKAFMVALRRAYSNRIDSLEDLERQWLKYISQ